MTQQLRQLRTELSADTSQYVRAVGEAERAAEALGQASAQVGRAVEETDKKTTKSAAGLAQLRRSVDPMTAANERLTKGLKTLSDAMAVGKIDDQEHARLKALLVERYDLAGQAATRAAKAQADAAKAVAAAAAAEEAGLQRLRGRYDENFSAAGKYNAALADLATLQRAGALTGQSLAEAQAKIERELNPVNVALARQEAALDQLRDSLDPASAAARKLEQQERTLREAFERGTLSGLEYDNMLRKLRAGHDDAAAGAHKTGGALRDVLGDAAQEVTGRLGFAGEALMSLGRSGAGAVAGIAAAAVAVGALVVASIPAAGEFQKLQATLRTVGGSAQLAAAEFEMIKEFALQTPMSVGQVTEAFIKLKALGLDPSMEALRSYGNTAGAMGKSVQDMVEAVADATTGEFERLKEFGIKASQENGKVTFSFQNVKTTVANNATEIQKYLLAIGNTKFATGMAEQSNTLSGAIDSLSDNWQIFLANLGNSGPVQAATALIRALADAVSGLNSMLFPSIKEQVAAARGEVETLRREIAEMEKFPDAYGPEIAGRRAVLVERVKSLKALELEQAQREKLIQTSQTQAKIEEEVDKKAAEAAKKEAERRQAITDKLDIEYDERTRLLEATRQGKDAIIALNRELEGERAIREFLGTTNNKAAHQMMESNKILADQARAVQVVARQNYDLKVATDAVTEAQKAADEARKKSAEEAKRAQEKFASDIKETSEKISKDVSENIYDSLMDPDRATSVTDFFKSLFKRIAVEALAAKVILPITSQIVGSMPGMFGITAPTGAASGGGFTGMAGSLVGMGGMFPNAQASTVQFLNTPMWGSTSAGTEALINQTGSTAAAYDSPPNIAAGSGIAQSGPTWGTAGAGFGAGMGGGIIGATVGNATKSKAAGALTGAASGAMMGASAGPWGAAIGAVVGGVMGALGTGGKESNKEGNATYSLGSGRTAIGGQSGEKYSAENRAAAKGLAEGLGQVGQALGRYSGRDLASSLKIVVGSRDGMAADVNGKSAKFDTGETGKLGKFVITEFASQLGAALPGEIKAALARTDWSNLETAIQDIRFGADFRASLDALGKDMGLVDAATAQAKAEVAGLTDELMGFRETTARLGLDTNAANDATRRYVEGLLGMRAVEAPMTDVEQAVSVARVRFAEIVPLLQALGINADEAARALERTITAMRDDFIGGLDREFNDLSGNSWINQIDATFDILDERMRNAAALGGGSLEAMRNNHYAIKNILTALSDEDLGEAAARYGGDIAIIAESIKAARVVVGEAAPVVAQAVLDVAGFFKTLEREANESSGRPYINQISDQFGKMNEQLEIASRAGMGANIVLANNHRVMVNILNSLTDAQLADASANFGGNIAIIADSIRQARATLGEAAPAIQEALFDVAGWLRDMGREQLQLSNRGYLNSISDQFAKLSEQMAIAERVGVGSADALLNNHLAMVKILEDLTDDQLRDAAARFGGGIAIIAESLIAGRVATEAATAAQEAATKAQEAAAASQQKLLDAANERVERARDGVQRAYQKEIDAQQALADAAKTTGDNMRRFAGSFRDLKQSLLTSDLSPLSPEARYNEARAQFQEVAGKAAAGDETAMGQLEGVAQTFLQQSRAYYASSATYAQDFAQVQEALTRAEASAGAQASAADAQLAQAQAQTGLLQSQLDAINGTTSAVMSIAGALAELTAALVGQAAAGGGGSGAGAGTVGGIDVIGAAYQQYLGRAPDAVGYANWQNQLSGGGTLAGVVSGIAGSDEAYVRGLYATLLDRAPDAGGLATWMEALRSGMSRAEVEALIKASPEGKSRGYEAGGMVTNGRWNSDSVTAMLAGGEFVTRAPSVNSGTLATLSHINRTGAVPANDTGGAISRLQDETRRQTAALQEGFLQLIKLTGQQTADISDLRAAQRRKAAS